MRFVGVCILVLAAVIAVVGWRATTHHKSSCPSGNKLACVLSK